MRLRATCSLLAATSLVLAPAASATAAPPGIPSTATAISQLDALGARATLGRPVGPPGASSGIYQISGAR